MMMMLISLMVSSLLSSPQGSVVALQGLCDFVDGTVAPPYSAALSSSSLAWCVFYALASDGDGLMMMLIQVLVSSFVSSRTCCCCGSSARTNLRKTMHCLSTSASLSSSTTSRVSSLSPTSLLKPESTQRHRSF